MLKEMKRHGFRKGVRVWFTWGSVHDIKQLSARTRWRRAVYQALGLRLVFG